MSDVLTIERLTLTMHRLWCGPTCPLTEATVMLDRPITECVVTTTARIVPPALPALTKGRSVVDLTTADASAQGETPCASTFTEEKTSA